MSDRQKEVIVIGGGGHGKVVISLLQELGYRVNVVLDDDESKWGSTLLAVPVEGPIEKIRALGFDGAILAVGDNRIRLTLAERYKTVPWIPAVHPRSWVHPSVSMGAGSVVFAGAVIQPETRMGTHCIVNTGATVDHDCFIEDGVHIAPGCHLAGGVSVGKGSFLGVGVSVIPGISIGSGVIVGAGAAVVSDLPGDVLAVGVPAKPIRSLLSGKKES